MAQATVHAIYHVPSNGYVNGAKTSVPYNSLNFTDLQHARLFPTIRGAEIAKQFELKLRKARLWESQIEDIDLVIVEIQIYGP